MASLAARLIEMSDVSSRISLFVCFFPFVSDVCWPRASETVALIKRLDSADYIVSRNEMSPIESCLVNNNSKKEKVQRYRVQQQTAFLFFLLYFYFLF